MRRALHPRFLAALALALAVLAASAAATHDGLVAAATFVYFAPGRFPQPLDLVGASVTAGRVQFQDPAGRVISADLYLPGTPAPHSAVVLVHGWTRLAERDPGAVRFGQAFARAGQAVLIPRFEKMRLGLIDQSAIDGIVGAVRYLGARPDVRRGRIGLFGVCLGGSMGLRAAADPRMPPLAVVAALNPVFDVVDYIQAATTGTVTERGRTAPWAAATPVRQMLRINTEALERDFPTAVPAIRAMLANRDPARTRALFEALPAEVRDRLDVASPGAVIWRVKGEPILVQALGDPIVPPGTLERFKAALAGRIPADVAGTANPLMRHDGLRPPPLDWGTLRAAYLPGAAGLVGALSEMLGQLDS